MDGKWEEEEEEKKSPYNRCWGWPLGSVNCSFIFYFSCFRFLHIIYIPFYSFSSSLFSLISTNLAFSPFSLWGKRIASIDRWKEENNVSCMDGFLFIFDCGNAFLPYIWIVHLPALYWRSLWTAQSKNGKWWFYRGSSLTGAPHELHSRVASSFSLSFSLSFSFSTCFYISRVFPPPGEAFFVMHL